MKQILLPEYNYYTNLLLKRQLSVLLHAFLVRMMGALQWPESHLLHGVLASPQNFLSVDLYSCGLKNLLPLFFQWLVRSSFLVGCRIPFKNKQKYYPGCYIVCSYRVPPISLFYDKLPDKSGLRGEQFIMVGEIWRKECVAAGNIALTVRMLVPRPLSPFYSVQEPSPWDAGAHIQSTSSFLPWLSLLEIPSQPQMCVHDDSKFSQVTMKMSYHNAVSC